MVSIGLVPSESGEGQSVPWLLPSYWSSGVSWFVDGLVPVSSHCLPTMYLFCVQIFCFIKTQFYWIRVYPRDLILT